MDRDELQALGADLPAPVRADFEAGVTTEQAVEEAAKTSVTVFLILVGMLVVVFVEPPVKAVRRRPPFFGSAALTAALARDVASAVLAPSATAR